MKKVLKVGGVVVGGLLIVLAVLRVTGFEPRLCYHSADSWTCKVPGLWLAGNLVTTPVSDWSFVDNYPEIKIQTRTRYLLPLSVTTGSIAAAWTMLWPRFAAFTARMGWS